MCVWGGGAVKNTINPGNDFGMLPSLRSNEHPWMLYMSDICSHMTVTQNKPFAQKMLQQVLRNFGIPKVE